MFVCAKYVRRRRLAKTSKVRNPLSLGRALSSPRLKVSLADASVA
jgi:hypothetical protein